MELPGVFRQTEATLKISSVTDAIAMGLWQVSSCLLGTSLHEIKIESSSCLRLDDITL